MQNEKKNKHMTLEDRIEIQECLHKAMSFKAIAKRVGKNPTTVAREVRQRAVDYRNSYVTTNDICPQLLKAPFVCNACPKRSTKSCCFQRRIYVAKNAQKDYQMLLVDSRTGVPLNKE